jgi:hypothetical protein
MPFNLFYLLINFQIKLRKFKNYYQLPENLNVCVSKILHILRTICNFHTVVLLKNYYLINLNL